MIQQQIDIVRWAREALEDEQPVVILDTETTGLDDDAEIVEISIIDRDGEVLLDSLVRPSCSIPPGAQRVHGITDEMVSDAPTIAELYPELMEAIKDARVLVYNAPYDYRLIQQSLNASGFGMSDELPPFECVMEPYSEFWGDWNSYHKSYTWQGLERACRQQKVDCSDLVKAHRALGDCQRTLRLLRAMAEKLDEAGQAARDEVE